MLPYFSTFTSYESPVVKEKRKNISEKKTTYSHWFSIETFTSAKEKWVFCNKKTRFDEEWMFTLPGLDLAL